MDESELFSVVVKIDEMVDGDESKRTTVDTMMMMDTNRQKECNNGKSITITMIMMLKLMLNAL